MRTPKFVLLVAFVAALTMSVPAAADTIITQVSPAGSGTLLSYNTGTAGTSGGPVDHRGEPAWPAVRHRVRTVGPALRSAPATPLQSGHATGRWFHKTVLNESGVNWTSFELELQIELGLPSLDGDGLSFAQGSGFTFSSNLFPVYTAIEDIRDYLNFHGGVVMPGQTVEFTFRHHRQQREQSVLAARDSEQVPKFPSPARCCCSAPAWSAWLAPFAAACASSQFARNPLGQSEAPAHIGRRGFFRAPSACRESSIVTPKLDRARADNSAGREAQAERRTREFVQAMFPFLGRYLSE